MERLHVKTFEQFIEDDKVEEKSGTAHDYGCVMLYLNVDEKNWADLQESIDDEDVYEKDGDYGREDEPHVTVLYGLHEDNDDDDIKKAMMAHEFSDPIVSMQRLSLFENDDFDVLKFDVNSKDLNKMNETLAEFPHTTDYPDYHAHCTVAYLKPGTGKKYAKKLKEAVVSKPDKIVYSKTDGSKLKWPFKKAKNE